MAFLERKYNVDLSIVSALSDNVSTASFPQRGVHDDPELTAFSGNLSTKLSLPACTLHDETSKRRSGGQTVHSELGTHQSEAVQPCGCYGEEMLVEMAYTDHAAVTHSYRISPCF